MREGLEYIIVGIVLIVVGIVATQYTNHQKQVCTEEINATIVKIEYESNYDNDTKERDEKYYPVIEYTVNGRTVTKKCKELSKKINTFKKGEKIPILYNPKNIDECILKEKKYIFSTGTVLIIIGAIALIWGVIQKISLY